MDELLTITEVAKELKKHYRTVERMFADGRLHTTINGPLRTRRSTLEAYQRLKRLDTEYFEILEAIKVAAQALAYTPISDDRYLQVALARLARYEAAQQAQDQSEE